MRAVKKIVSWYSLQLWFFSSTTIQSSWTQKIQNYSCFFSVESSSDIEAGDGLHHVHVEEEQCASAGHRRFKETKQCLRSTRCVVYCIVWCCGPLFQLDDFFAWKSIAAMLKSSTTTTSVGDLLHQDGGGEEGLVSSSYYSAKKFQKLYENKGNWVLTSSYTPDQICHWSCFFCILKRDSRVTLNLCPLATLWG